VWLLYSWVRAEPWKYRDRQLKKKTDLDILKSVDPYFINIPDDYVESKLGPLGVDFGSLTEEQFKNLQDLGMVTYGPSPWENHESGLPAFLFGIPVVVDFVFGSRRS
jgi:hypothetical protein